MKKFHNVIVYDIETLRVPEEVDGGWNNPAGMGFGIACAYNYADDTYCFFDGEDGRNDLCDMLNGKLAVTFNGISFDSRVLLGNDRRLLHDVTLNLRYQWYNFDILAEYIKSRYGYTTVAKAEKRLGDKSIHDGSFNLDGIAEGTLGMHKNGTGALAPRLLDSGQYSKVYGYCLHDVRLTRKLLEHIHQHHAVTDRSGRVVRIFHPISLLK